MDADQPTKAQLALAGYVPCHILQAVKNGMLHVTIDGVEQNMTPELLIDLAYRKGNEDARAILEPDFAAHRQQTKAEHEKSIVDGRRRQFEERRAALNPAPPGADIAPQALGVTDPGCLDPFMHYQNDIMRSCSLAMVCCSWRDAVCSWRSAVTEVALHTGRMNENRIGDIGIAALVRDCPRLSHLALWYGNVKKHPGSLEFTLRGFEHIMGFVNLRSLMLYDAFEEASKLFVESEVATICAALRTLGAQLETLRLPARFATDEVLPALTEAAASANRLRHLHFATGISESSSVLDAIANIPSLKSLSLWYLPISHLRTEQVESFAVGRPHLALLRFHVGGSVASDTTWDPIEALSILARNCPDLVNIKLTRESWEFRRYSEHPGAVPFDLPPPTAATWHQHIEKCSENEHIPLRHMASIFPTEAEVESEVARIELSLRLLGQSCPRLQHLELQFMQLYHCTHTFMPASRYLEDTEEWQFPSLQYLDVSGWDCINGDALMGLLLIAAPMLKIMVVRNGMIDYEDIRDLIEEPIPTPDEFVMLDITGCDACRDRDAVAKIMDGTQAGTIFPGYLFRENHWIHVQFRVQNPPLEQLRLARQSLAGTAKKMLAGLCMCDSCSELRIGRSWRLGGHLSDEEQEVVLYDHGTGCR